MKQLHFFALLLLLILLIACSNAVETAVIPTKLAATHTPMVETAVPTQTAVPQPTKTATAVATVASQPIPETDPYTLAWQIVDQTVLPNSDIWQIRPCEGEAAVFCIAEGQENAGFAELLLFPLAGYTADHPIHLAAANLPAADYSAEDEAASLEALTFLAEEYLESICADRGITTPADSFVPLEMEAVAMGGLPALAFGFVRSNEAGEIQERYLNVAAFDQQFIYWFAVNYDPPNVSTFVSDTAVTRFAPTFYDIAARLPIHQEASAVLPEFISGISQQHFCSSIQKS